MARWWKAFETQEERTAWENQQKKDNPNFKVCMRYPASELEREMGMPKGHLSPYKYATVYRLDYDPGKGY